MAGTSRTPAKHTPHNPHTTQKISEMLIVVIIILLLIVMAVFVVQRYEYSSASDNSIIDVQAQAALNSVANQQEFQPVTAPPGVAVTGFPVVLVPAHGQITSSDHTEYNGYDQYMLNLTVNVSMANEYTALQPFLTKAGFKIAQKSSTTTMAMINAKQGSDYVTAQLTPTNANTTSVTIIYGKLIQ